MTAAHQSASFTATLRVQIDDRPGAFAGLARAIGDAGGAIADTVSDDEFLPENLIPSVFSRDVVAEDAGVARRHRGGE